MPWEETDQYIRSGHKDPGRYETCRTIDIDQQQGIKAIYCRLKGADRWEIQSYLFSKAKGWTMSRAEEWFSRHQASALSLRFIASLQDWEEKDGKHTAIFYLLDTSVNRNNWRVTDQALEKALPGLVGKPLSAKPGYRVDHITEPIDIGTFVGIDKPDGYGLGVAEITDPTAWEKIKSREWGPVSVEITARKVVCSKCGRDILVDPCEHVLHGEAYEDIHEFGLDRVAFVSEPAYPMAGVLFAASQSPRGDEPKGALNPEVSKGGKRVTDEKIAELQKELEAVTAEKKKLEEKLAGKEKKLAEKVDLETKVKDLQAKLDEIRAERHLERVAEVVDRRVQAGLIEDRNAEIERLKDFDERTLEILKVDAEAFIAEKQKIARLAGPKAKFSAASQDEVQKKIEETRERFFGHKNPLQLGGAEK